jgi:hypothetical protein
LQDIGLAANSQRISDRLYHLLAAGEGGRCPNRVILDRVGRGNTSIYVRFPPIATDLMPRNELTRCAHQRTHAPQLNSSLFNHLIGRHEHRLRHGEAEHSLRHSANALSACFASIAGPAGCAYQYDRVSRGPAPCRARPTGRRDCLAPLSCRAAPRLAASARATGRRPSYGSPRSPALHDETRSALMGACAPR